MVDAGRVLMHRLALGALWPVSGLCGDLLSARGINAPFGARCFITHNSERASCLFSTGLNAPYDARFFLT